MMRSIIAAAAIGAVVGSALAGGVVIARAQSPASTVSIDNFTFTPQQLTIKAGTTSPGATKTISRTASHRRPTPSANPGRWTPTTATRSRSPRRSYQYFCYIHRI